MVGRRSDCRFRQLHKRQKKRPSRAGYAWLSIEQELDKNDNIEGARHIGEKLNCKTALASICLAPTRVAYLTGLCQQSIMITTLAKGVCGGY